jgi:hypothetical protein
MRLYHVERTDEIDYDEFSDFVCVAENDEEARNIHPREDKKVWGEDYDYWNNGSWINKEDINSLKVKEIGLAKPELTRSVICASFHAG